VLRQLTPDTSLMANEGRATFKTPTSSKVAITEQPRRLDSNVKSNNQLGLDIPEKVIKERIVTCNASKSDVNEQDDDRNAWEDFTRAERPMTSGKEKRKRQLSDIDINHTPAKRLLLRLPCQSLVTKGQGSETRSCRYGRKYPALALRPRSNGP